jgi:NAD(P)H dehydrogenase (quinone)
MRHLVVAAHPREGSFTLALARAHAAELEALGHQVVVQDLYRMGFDPVLTAAELMPPRSAGPGDSTITEAQEAIRAAEVLSVVYPLWWMSMPAILKGYVDRVFARGFAYEATGGVVRGLLSGRRCFVATVSGAPLSQLVASGRWQAAEMLHDIHIFRAAGFDVLEHLHFDEVVPDLSREVAEAHLSRLRASTRRHFGPGTTRAVHPET